MLPALLCSLCSGKGGGYVCAVEGVGFASVQTVYVQK